MKQARHLGTAGTSNRYLIVLCTFLVGMPALHNSHAGKRHVNGSGRPRAPSRKEKGDVRNLPYLHKGEGSRMAQDVCPGPPQTLSPACAHSTRKELFSPEIAAEERTEPVCPGETAMPLRRNADAVAPERRCRCTGTPTPFYWNGRAMQKGCGCPTPISCLWEAPSRPDMRPIARLSADGALLRGAFGICSLYKEEGEIVLGTLEMEKRDLGRHGKPLRGTTKRREMEREAVVAGERPERRHPTAFDAAVPALLENFAEVASLRRVSAGHPGCDPPSQNPPCRHCQRSGARAARREEPNRTEIHVSFPVSRFRASCRAAIPTACRPR